MYSFYYSPDDLTIVSTDDRGVDLWIDTDGSYWCSSVEDPRPIPAKFGPYGPTNRRGKTIAR